MASAKGFGDHTVADQIAHAFFALLSTALLFGTPGRLMVVREMNFGSGF